MSLVIVHTNKVLVIFVHIDLGLLTFVHINLSLLAIVGIGWVAQAIASMDGVLLTFVDIGYHTLLANLAFVGMQLRLLLLL
jgi:hypothetical protein